MGCGLLASLAIGKQLGTEHQLLALRHCVEERRRKKGLCMHAFWILQRPMIQCQDICFGISCRALECLSNFLLLSSPCTGMSVAASILLVH